MKRTLARFRADPKKVRVSIRHTENGFWLAQVMQRDGHGFIGVGCENTPVKAVMIALARADEHVPGVDLDMERAYEHPFGKEDAYD